MIRYSLILTLMLCTSANAGAVIYLVPAPPANGTYQPGEAVRIDVLVQLTPGTPSVPGPEGTTTAIRLHSMQLDFSDSFGLEINAVNHHPGSDLGPIPFWNFSGSTACASNEAACGANYSIDGDINDDLVSITFNGLNSSGSQMITLNQTLPKRVAELSIIFPSPGSDCRLDVLNADDPDINHGAEIRWGFGSTADPSDPTSPMRANSLTAGGGGIVMEPGQEGGIRCFIPEPATLALFGLGILASALRRPAA